MGQADRLISILVATRNRARSLRALLASLDQLLPPPGPYEIILVDNGSTDDTPALLQAWQAAAPNRVVIRVAPPGKSRALNTAIRASNGEWLVFLDDDLVVVPDYLAKVWEYCGPSDCAAAQGSIALPVAATADPEVRALLARYPDMVPQVAAPVGARPVKLVGANMAVRRAVLMQVGLFDDRLGPGASGFGEDHDLAEKILATGGWIGSMPDARATHELDRTRFTQQAFLERARKLGRGDYLKTPRPVWTWIVPRLAVTGLRLALTTAGGLSHARQRALARWRRYQGMIEMSRQQSRP